MSLGLCELTFLLNYFCFFSAVAGVAVAAAVVVVVVTKLLQNC